jgi:hypothetical protein
LAAWPFIIANRCSGVVLAGLSCALPTAFNHPPQPSTLDGPFPTEPPVSAELIYQTGRINENLMKMTMSIGAIFLFQVSRKPGTMRVRSMIV